MTRSWPGERASSSSSGPRARGPRRFRLAAAPRLAQWFSGDRARPGRQRPRRLPHAALASPWLRRDGATTAGGWKSTTRRLDRTRCAPDTTPPGQLARPVALAGAPPPGVSHLPAPPPESPAHPAASSCRALARTCEERRRSAGQSAAPAPLSPFTGREVSMGLPLPPPVPPPPPPPGAISMARRRRRSASSETQVDPAGPGRVGAMGKGRERQPERARDGAR